MRRQWLPSHECLTGARSPAVGARLTSAQDLWTGPQAMGAPESPDGWLLLPESSPPWTTTALPNSDILSPGRRFAPLMVISKRPLPFSSISTFPRSPR
jgi:hypothetical protein